MENKLDLLKDYSRDKHITHLNTKNAVGVLLTTSKLKRIYSKSWENEHWLLENKVPYESLTYLLDAYYCLPRRPDMGFAFLWMSINSTYKKALLRNPIEKYPTDDNCIAEMLTELEKKLQDKVQYRGKDYTILQIIEMHVEKMPLKVYRFIANYILKGIVIDSLSFPSKYQFSSYKTLKKHFKDIHAKIANTYADGFKNICNPVISNDLLEVDLQIDENDDKKKEKSRTIPTSLSKKLRELVKSRSSKIYSEKFSEQDKEKQEPLETLTLDNDFDYLNFIFRIVIYSIRNNSFHGSIASRLNSDNAGGSSVNASNYVFILGHLFLTLFMYCIGELELDDLKINLDNLTLLD
ncbi:hypothetical protein COF67_25375 [Bacillus toyonensis]|uniref:hypothetical protein n=1 Tax=Bacillus toyonensis TaxID=155322 RepID=UPI000BFDED5B|nr:hypothetical protein [Bacillus toyonensis]PHD44851.1 hypothetical protein COF67_25375 [Bacillus toyonensis]